MLKFPYSIGKRNTKIPALFEDCCKIIGQPEQTNSATLTPTYVYEK